MFGNVAIDPKNSGVGQASGKSLQYMGAGLPVICFDRKNNREYLEDAGYYVRDFSVDGLASGIISFCENKEIIKKMSRHSKERAQKFTWDVSAQKIINIYKKLKTNE